MSESSSPPPTDPSSSVADSPWAQASLLASRGVPRADIAAALRASGVDETSVRVVLNALLPTASPEVPLPQLDLGPVALTPQAAGRWVAEAGLRGPRHVVGLYWLAFGSMLVVLAGGVLVVQAAEVVRWPPSALLVLQLAPWFVALGAGCAVRGAYLVVTGVQVRRKP